MHPRPDVTRNLSTDRFSLMPPVLLAALLGTSSCGNDTGSASPGTIESWSLSEEPSVVIGGADEREGYLLHRIFGATRLGDGRIVVANGSSLELKYDGIGDDLREDPASALSVTGAEDVEVLFYLSAAWGLAISNALDQPDLVGDLPAVRALLARALELDEDYGRGSIHAALITLESLPAQLGGSPARAREHFERAVELSDGLDAGPYVTFALGVSVPEEDRAEFEDLLNRALAIDPDENTDQRLLNVVNQRRARLLLDVVDDLFFE